MDRGAGADGLVGVGEAPKATLWFLWAGQRATQRSVCCVEPVAWSGIITGGGCEP